MAQLRKPRTRAGEEAWALICVLVQPVLPAVTTITQIKAAAHVVLKSGPGFPPGRIEEAADRRCGWPTKHAIEDRARQLGLLKEERAQARREDAEYIDRLRLMQRNATQDQADAIEWAIGQLQARNV